MKYLWIEQSDLDKISLYICAHYPWIDGKRSIFEKSILNSFLSIGISMILKVKRDEQKYGYHLWYIPIGGDYNGH